MCVLVLCLIIILATLPSIVPAPFPSTQGDTQSLSKLLCLYYCASLPDNPTSKSLAILYILCSFLYFFYSRSIKPYPSWLSHAVFNAESISFFMILLGLQPRVTQPQFSFSYSPFLSIAKVFSLLFS